VFTAHSVPEAADTDAYREQVERTAALVAAAARLGQRGVPWRVAWQSAGRTEQSWIGPDLFSTLDAVAATDRRSVVVCPVGFVADHLEILYDLDVEARARAEALGLSFARTESLNADPAFLSVLAGAVSKAAASLRVP
jgi:ferrochelatase